MKKLDNKGFGGLVLLLVIEVVVIISLGGYIGYRMTQSDQTEKSASISVGSSSDVPDNVCTSDCVAEEFADLQAFVITGIKSGDLTGDPNLTSGTATSLQSQGKTYELKQPYRVFVDVSSGSYCISIPFGRDYVSATKGDPEMHKTLSRCKSATDTPV